MTIRSSLTKLGRVGAATAAMVALVGLAACIKPTPPSANATNTAGLAPANTAAMATPPAAANTASLDTGNAIPGAPVATPGAVPTPGAPGTPATPGAQADLGAAGALGSPSGGGGGGPGPQADNDQSDVNGNDEFDRNFINACFRTAVHNGNSTQTSARYCTCAMGELDQLSLAQKQALTAGSPQVTKAENDCR